ncbi:hypothetical protein WMY93_025660 [Mugilogobius chulae]|uniref:Uncharacterized protein n=1 Tax=Mugilogobius chulae TaxID=88201 RepID=A0AAW0MYS9_9GOBI
MEKKGPCALVLTGKHSFNQLSLVCPPALRCPVWDGTAEEEEGGKEGGLKSRLVPRDRHVLWPIALVCGAPSVPPSVPPARPAHPGGLLSSPSAARANPGLGKGELPGSQSGPAAEAGRGDTHRHERERARSTQRETEGTDKRVQNRALKRGQERRKLSSSHETSARWDTSIQEVSNRGGTQKKKQKQKKKKAGQVTHCTGGTGV